MPYKLSTSLIRIISSFMRVASEYGLQLADAPVFMLAILRDGKNRCVELLESNGINTKRLAEIIAAPLNAVAPAPTSVFSVSSSINFLSDNGVSVALSNEGSRIMRLMLFEARQNGDEEADETHLLLAILRDKDNEARKILNDMGITYAAVSSLLMHQQDASAGFSYADDAPQDPLQEDADNPNPGYVRTTQRDNASSDTPIIDNFGTDITRLAAEGALDPVVGRENEILRMAQILSRRKKNNPILIGMPGVGKSALVEGLAALINARKVPHNLQDKRIVALDMSSIVAGTQYRGQFEERLRRLIQELRDHKEIILFIDEIHTIIGAGSAPGSLDAANILKPALARGEVQCIGATTTDEYRKTIEKDGALERRFQKIQIEPTTHEETLQILHNIKSRYEEHHNVAYSDEAIESCVSLSEKYITDRVLPDKAIDILDEAGSRVHIANDATPPHIRDMETTIEELKKKKSAFAQAQNYEAAAKLRDELAEKEAQLQAHLQQWQAERKDKPVEVSADDIANVVSLMSGVPVERVAQAEQQRLKNMHAALSEKVIAQDEAIRRLANAITMSRLGLRSHNRPIGTFLFVGPTGVGKTYLVKTLAEWMFGKSESLIRIDMSEYGEKFSTSRLVGAPPGYVGYDEGGQLTEQVRRHPYSVVLLDEIEKAHPDVFNMLLQVMDEGRLTDGNGVTVDFRNTIIIMTSNSGTRQLKDFARGIGFQTKVQDAISADTAESIVRKALRNQFSPEFLNRLDDIIMFNPLNAEAAARIAQLQIAELSERLAAMNIQLSITPAAREYIVQEGWDAQYGARAMKRSIQKNVEEPLSRYLLDAPLEERNGKIILKLKLSDGKIEVEPKV